MNLKNVFLTGCAGALMGVSAMAQQQGPAPTQANPAPGCHVTPEQLEANKKVAMAFFTSDGPGKVALADPTYKQHNPVFVKRAAENKVSDYEEFKTSFLAQRPGGPGGPGGPAGGQGQQRQGGGAMPRGNPFEIVTAECDIVTIVHKRMMPDPTADGKFYETFSFDTFRVKDGKLTEHWDPQTLPMRRQQQPQQ